MKVKLLLLFAPTALFAQYNIAENWTLSQYLQKSLETSESVTDQTLATQKARAALDEQQAAFYPTISASAQSSKTDTIGNPPHAQVVNSNIRTQTAITLSQNLFNGFRDNDSYNSAAAVAAQNEFLLQNVKRTQIQNAIDEFFTIMQYQSDIENLRKEIAFNEQSLKTTQRKIRAGNARQTQAINLQSTLAANHLELTNTEALLIVERNKVARQLKIDTTTLSFHHVPKFDPTKADACLNHLDVNGREDLLAQRANTQALAAQLGVAQAVQLPKLDLNASFIPTDSQTSPTLKDQYTVTLALSVPLPFGAQKRAQIAQSRLALEMAQKAETEKILDLDLQKAQLIDGLNADVSQLQMLEESTKFSNQNVEAIRSDHKVGLASYNDVLVAFSNYQQVIRQYDRAKLSFERDCYRALAWSQDPEQLIPNIKGVQ